MRKQARAWGENARRHVFHLKAILFHCKALDHELHAQRWSHLDSRQSVFLYFSVNAWLEPAAEGGHILEGVYL